MNPLPMTTQGTCHHCYEANTNACREISNHYRIMLYGKRLTKADDVNMSIPW